MQREEDVMSVFDKKKNASGRDVDTSQQDARDSVYEAVHLDTAAQEGAHSALPGDVNTTSFPDSSVMTGNTTAYSTM